MSEYLTVADAAELLCVSPKRVRNLMSAGMLRRGEHWFSPVGLGPRFKRSALVAWIEGGQPVAPRRREGRAFAGLVDSGS